MTTSTVTYTGQLKTSATHHESGAILVTAAPRDNNGDGSAFSPTDMMSTSLASCMLTIMGIVARNHSLNIDGTRAEVTKIMESNPRRVGEIIVEVYLPENNFSEKDKQLLENAGRTCPVSKSLHPDLKQTMRFHF